MAPYTLILGDEKYPKEYLEDAISFAEQELSRTLIPRYSQLIILDCVGKPVMVKRWIQPEPLDPVRWLNYIRKHHRPPDHCYSDWIYRPQDL